MLFQAYQIYFQPHIEETTSPLVWRININTFFRMEPNDSLHENDGVEPKLESESLQIPRQEEHIVQSLLWWECHRMVAWFELAH